MPWVEKDPRRWDFCGCPPCGLCYDWTEELPNNGVVVEATQGRVDGFTKFCLDMVGETPAQINAKPNGKARLDDLQAAALLVHNLKVRSPSPAEVLPPEDTFKEQMQRQHMNMKLAALAKDAARTAKVVPLNRITCDSIELAPAPEGITQLNEGYVPLGYIAERGGQRWQWNGEKWDNLGSAITVAGVTWAS